MVLTKTIMPHVNVDPLGLTQKWMPSSRIDSKSQTITFNHYGDKLAFEEYDDLVTYWQQDGNAGLRRIVQSALGGMMMGKLERLARNGYLSHTHKYIGDGSLSSIGQVGASHDIDEGIIENIHLRMAEREVPYAIAPDGQANAIFCITTPGVISTIRSGATAGTWLDVQKYSNPVAVSRNEVGTWKGVRFLQTNLACLYNTGAITAQTTVTAAITQGDGADADSVDGTYDVGQQSGVTNYITVASASGFAVGDRVSIHVDRTSANGVTNGHDYTDGKSELRLITKISGQQISFSEPIMEDFATDLGGGVYAYMTLGRHIHTATFIGASGGVALGVGRKPRVNDPERLGIIDDTHSMYRFSWDAFLKYQLFTPEVFQVWYGAAPNGYW